MSVEKGLVLITFFLMGFVSLLVWKQNNVEHTAILLDIFRTLVIGLIGFLGKQLIDSHHKN